MKITKLLLFISLFTANHWISSAQEDEFERSQGLRLGVDVMELIMEPYTPDNNAFFFQMDYELPKEWFAALEFGRHRKEGWSENSYSRILGDYGLIGVNRNILDKGQRTHGDIVYWGARYGFSNYKHRIDSLLEIGEDENNKVAEYIDNSHNAHWFELLGGISAELWFAENVFFNLSARAKFLAAKNKDAIFIPGFGKASKTVAFDINWTVSYRIPFRKIKVKIIEDKDD